MSVASDDGPGSCSRTRSRPNSLAVRLSPPPTKAMGDVHVDKLGAQPPSAGFCDHDAGARATGEQFLALWMTQVVRVLARRSDNHVNCPCVR